MLRARRTRDSQMDKIQKSQNQIRYSQNVGKVPISMGAQAIIQKGPFGAKICWGLFLGNFGSGAHMGPIGALAAIPFKGGIW